MKAVDYERLYSELEAICAHILVGDELAYDLRIAGFDTMLDGPYDNPRHNYERHVNDQSTVYIIYANGDVIARLTPPPHAILYRLETSKHLNLLDKIIGEYPQVRVINEL